MDHCEGYDVMTAADLLCHLRQSCTRAGVSLVLEIDHRSLMIMVPDRPDETDNRTRPTVGNHALKISHTDRLVNDPGVHDGARENAVDHIHILPHRIERHHMG